MKNSLPADANPHDHLPLHFKVDRRSSYRTVSTARRYSERLYGSCQATVRGVNDQGENFTETTTLDNVSAGGLYVKLQYKVETGKELFIVFSFSTQALQNVRTPRLAIRGRVCRVDAVKDGIVGIGVQFQQHRFL